MSYGKDPMAPRKPDTTKNTEDLDSIIARQREREKNLYPVRINRTTVIYVRGKKRNASYAEKYERRMKKI